jgi:tetratricopeptide (TPR) repeat protein
VNLRQPGAAAIGVAAALLVAWPAVAAGPLDEAERQAASIEERLLFVETAAARPDESVLAHVHRKFSEGEIQFLLGDWLHAAVLLFDAVEQPEFHQTAEYPLSLAYLGEALRHQGACASALLQYDALLALGATSARPTALAGALECRIRLRRFEGIDALVQEAQAASPNGALPEIGYLAAKAAYHRTDLRPAERLQRATEAFAAVAPPYHLAAAYFQGVLELERGDLTRAAERFERCLTLEGKDERQDEVRELCVMALGRIYSDQGKFPESLDRYQAIPRESPRFNEAIYEIAWNYVRARNYDEAMRTAGMIVDLAPESQLAPEATILTGHLALRLGHYPEAVEAFDKVIAAYAPVRDELDAILTMHEDPVRYFDELIGRQGRAFDVATVLPPIAVKWATAQRDVGGALDLVSALETGRRDVDESGAVAARIEALLTRSDGLDAAPFLKSSWISAEALETAVVRLQGDVASLAVAAVQGIMPPAARAELDQVHGARQALQQRLEALPHSAGELQARQERMARRIEGVERFVFQMGYQVDAAAAAISATEAWLEQHRAEIVSDEAGRAEFDEELRSQRELVVELQEELRGLAREITQARDAAGGLEGSAAEAALRQEYRGLVVRERALVASARGGLPPGQAAELDRGEALLDRLDRAEQKALRLKELFAGAASRLAGGLRDRVAAERTALLEQQAALEEVVGDSRDVIGRIAFRSFSAVRAQFYRLVLKADIGLVDVAWSRKRERVERIQQLAQEKTTELEALDRVYKQVLRGDGE